MKKILVVDDEEMITDLISTCLLDKGYEVMVANSSEEALLYIPKSPNLIILDINMPSVNGLELCKNIRDYIYCPIIFLTARVEAHLRRDERSKNNLSIMTLADGLIINLSSRKIYFEKIEISFSKKEFDIIEFLIANSGQVFDKEQIYEKIWGYDALGDSNVVKEHIRKIRAKFKDVTGKEYIDTSWGVGYCWKN